MWIISNRSQVLLYKDLRGFRNPAGLTLYSYLKDFSMVGLCYGKLRNKFAPPFNPEQRILIMKRLKLYIETSVWNFYFADDSPEKKEVTIRFFELIKHGEYEIFISDMVFREIAKASDEKRALLSRLISEYQPKELELNDEIVHLAEKYIREGALPEKAADDSKHAAVASVYEMDALISWNLKHLANLKRMEKINGVNLKEGYSKRLELMTPMEVSDE